MIDCTCSTAPECAFPHDWASDRLAHHLSRGKSEDEAREIAMREIELASMVEDDDIDEEGNF